MDGNEIVRIIIEFIKQRWYRRSTLLILILFTAGILLWVFSGINLREVEEGEIWISGGVLLVVVSIWFFSNRIPKTPKGKIGFAIGIRTDDPEQQLKIKRDFVEALRDLLSRGRYKYDFYFIEVPNRLVEKADTLDNARRILYELKCAFMIYGTARTVMLKSEKQHVLNLEGVVSHNPVANEVSKSFSREFADLLPRRLTISSEGDLFHFEFTARWINVVSKYIIGIAALLSGDIEYAQELFESLQILMRDEKTEVPALVKIRDRLPRRLKDIYVIRLAMCYEDWKRTKEIENLEKMKPFLDALNSIAPGNHDAKVFSSMWHFVVEKDIAKAKQDCVSGKNKQNIAWRYNYAFLFAYEGNLTRARKEYKQAFQGYYQEPGFIFDIVDLFCGFWIENQIRPNYISVLD